MRSSSRSTAASDEDLTTRARIRDAAVDLFGREGFERTTVRAIAAAAGVSPALVVHHYGSKDRLRAACEEHLLDLVKQGKAAALAGGEAPSVQGYLAQVAGAEPLMRYLSRTLTDGGEAARRVFTGMVEDTVDYLAAAERAGTVRPTEDPTGRATVLVSWGLANLVLGPLIQHALDDTDQPTAMARVAGPALEVYTHGLFTDARFLEAFRKETPA